jgi:serine/threonine-protein kinase
VKIPRTLGRYEVIDLIGQGGMGALYRARDPRIGRYVAIKLLRPGYDTPELRDRFSREAAAAGSLSHPNIVTIYDVGEHDGLPFIAMEYVRGETFADLVCLRPPLSVLRKVQLTEEVCAGLAHAHEAGIVHRDIKPANLIVGPEGTVKILDFGIAKLSATGITQPGAIMGTLNYMSPEQVKGTPVDARADIFAVGAVLYELLSHQQAFPGQVPDEVLHLILHGNPTPITEYCPDLDRRLVQLVERALEKNPDVRFQNIAAVQKELASIRLSPQSAVPAPPPAPSRKTPRPADRDLAAAHARQIEEHLSAAQRAFEAGNYDAAIESCKRVLLLNASEERAISYIDRIHAAIDDQSLTRQVTIATDSAGARAVAAAAEAATKARHEENRIRAAVDEARRRFVNGEHQVALQSLEALHATSHPLVAGTLEELRRTLRELEEQRRLEKERVERQRRITALLADAWAALKDLRLAEAERALELVREVDPTVPELSGLTERVRQAQAAARLNEELERTLGDFDEQLSLDELPRASDLLQAAATLAPTDSRVHAARQRFDQATAEARLREGEERIDEAAAHLAAGDVAGAAAALKLAAELAPQHPRAAELAVQVREAFARQAAAEAAERLRRQVEELIRSASQRLQAADDNANDLVVALREVNEALALDPENANAPKLRAAIEESIATRREAARARTAISNARRRFANGKHQAAIKLLEDYPPPSHPEIAETLVELRAALLEIEEQRRAERERIERQQRIAALLVEARLALREQRFDAALGLLSNVEELDPAVPDLSLLREQVRLEEAAARLNEEIERTLDDFEEQLSLDELPRAGDLLQAAATLAPTDSRVHAARQRLDQATAALAARKAAEARRREGEQRIDEAAAHLAAGDLAGAAAALKLAAELAPQHPRAAELAVQIQEAFARQAAAEAAERLRRQVEELIRTASQRLQTAADDNANDLVVALREVNQALALDPENAEAAKLRAAIEESIATRREAARARTAISNARRRFANGKHQAALKLLEDYPPPSHPEIAETLIELRAALLEIEEQRRAERERIERQQRIAALLGEARLALREQRFDAALGLLSNVAELDPAVPELSSLREQVRLEEAAARQRAELERTLTDLDDRVTRGDLVAASDLLSAATALSPADPRVVSARQRVERAIAARDAAEARARDLEEKNAAAEELFERGDLQGAMRLLTLAANLDPQHPRTVQLSERVAEAIAKREAAEAAERLARTVDELLAAATEHLRLSDQQPHDALLAMRKITEALALVPDHEGALALKATAGKALAAQREAAFVLAAIRNARSRFAIGKHQAALQLLENLDPTAHPVVAETLAELRAALHEIQERRRAEQDRMRSSEATVISIPEPADPAVRHQAVQAPEATEGKAAAQPEAAVRPQKLTGRQPVVTAPVAVNDDATRVLIPAPGADTSERRADEVDLHSSTPPAENLEVDSSYVPVVDVQGSIRIQQAQAVARPGRWVGIDPWRWEVLAGAGVLLLAILAALFFLL